MWFVQKFAISVRGGQYDCWSLGVKIPTYATASPLRWRRSFLPAGCLSLFSNWHRLFSLRYKTARLKPACSSSSFAFSSNTQYQKCHNDSSLLRCYSLSTFPRLAKPSTATTSQFQQHRCENSFGLWVASESRIWPHSSTWVISVVGTHDAAQQRTRSQTTCLYISGDNWGAVVTTVKKVPLQKRWENFWGNNCSLLKEASEIDSLYALKLSKQH
jgi:hypothetical protein